MTEAVEPTEPAPPARRQPWTGTDPKWDPVVRRRVQRALNKVTLEAKDILERYARNGLYQAPNEVAEVGDVYGLMQTGRLQVLDRLEAVIDEARRVMAEVRDDLDAYSNITRTPGNNPYAWPRKCANCESRDANET